jgi:hypothetical protein
MVKEERSLRTRLAAGSKRRIARRIKRRFQLQALQRIATSSRRAKALEHLPLNTKEEDRENCELNRLERFEADTMPSHSSIFYILLRPQLTPPAASSSSASAAQ